MLGGPAGPATQGLVRCWPPPRDETDRARRRRRSHRTKAFFDADRIDTAAKSRRVDFDLGIGATGLTAPGELGEAPKLTNSAGVDVKWR